MWHQSVIPWFRLPCLGLPGKRLDSRGPVLPPRIRNARPGQVLPGGRPA